MASRSKDGEIISRWLNRNGYAVVRGSTTRGGAGAPGDGRHVRPGAGGPDRGRAQGASPRRSARDSAARPPDRRLDPADHRREHEPWFLESWDRYLVPNPFSRSVVVVRRALPDPGARRRGAILARIGASIDAITREADAAVGVRRLRPGSRE